METSNFRTYLMFINMFNLTYRLKYSCALDNKEKLAKFDNRYNNIISFLKDRKPQNKDALVDLMFRNNVEIALITDKGLIQL